MVDDQIDLDLLTKWQMYLAQAQCCYLCMEMPRKFNYEGQPLAVIAVKQEGRLVQAKSLTNEPQMSDTIIRIVNEPDMFTGTPVTFETNLDVILIQHVSSYTSGNQLGYV